METAGYGVISSAATAQTKPRGISRLLFIDNIKVFLTFLVITHHLMIIYAGTGNWPYYTEGRQDIITYSLGGWYCATNQAYFMGLFLLIGAYFVPGSYDRKGAWRFLKDRLIRLGIPLAIYSWIINPLFVYFILYRDKMPIWRFFPGEYFSSGEYIGQGPLWFVETLLIFSLVYVLWRFIVRTRTPRPAGETRFPRNWVIAVLALILGIASFLVRTIFIMDTDRLMSLNLQLPFFVQYMALFIFGLLAFQRKWLQTLPDKSGRLWLIIAGVLVLFWAPMMIFNGAIDGNTLFKGGLNWQSLVYALWESFLCLSMCIGLVYVFRRYFNLQNGMTKFLVPNAYTAYLIHAPVITFLALAIQDVTIYPFLKWAVAALIAVSVCFGLSGLIRKLPYTEKVL